MYDRIKNLFNDVQIDKLNKANILLVGLGGVGSPIFECLIRTGIKNITIVDFDTYELSNLNRQIHSNLDNIGKYKTDVLKEYAKSINPDINVDVKCLFLEENTDINYEKYDFVIDACDSINAKVLLIQNAAEKNIPIICSMGVGNRVDVNKMSICKLPSVTGDPLAKKLRKQLNEKQIQVDIPVLASSELPKKSKNIGSYIGVTMTAGIIIADYVVKEIIK